MSAFGNLSSLDLQRIWDGVHVRVVHGDRITLGMTGGDQAAATNYDAVADQHGFVVAYPDGIDFSWADGRGASIPSRTSSEIGARWTK